MRCVLTSAAASGYEEVVARLEQAGAQVAIAEELAEGAASVSEMAARLISDVGIVVAIAGVAETGSILPSDDTLPARLVGMLSDTVYALLPAGAILPGLDELGELLLRLTAEGRRYLSLVTGPSRTADI